MSPMITLMFAIVSEVIATTSLKLSEGFSKPLPSIVVVVGYAVAFYFLSITLKNMSLGVAYAIWSGLGTIGAVMAGLILWQEGLSLPRILGIVLIVAGVVLLNISTQGTAA